MCYLRLFKTLANQSALDRGFSSMFWWLRSAKHVKLTEEYVICTDDPVLIFFNV